MKSEYDFSNASKNPYVHTLKRQIATTNKEGCKRLVDKPRKAK